MARVQVFPVVLLLVMVNVEAGHRLCNRPIGFCSIFQNCSITCRRAGYVRGVCQGIFPRRCICYKRCKP
ncbi:unnamed protein product [Spirodela intermedia]|uniref:Knottins-like domain-containing protein n=1 Tax=Spirodela intermedia TaxID=51605 RepID=A0A7I8LJD0_SPIIN|nr:unnamed protein product [Spirodela intermedia]